MHDELYVFVAVDSLRFCGGEAGGHLFDFGAGGQICGLCGGLGGVFVLYEGGGIGGDEDAVVFCDLGGVVL